MIDILLESIKKSMNTMLMILGTITLFFVINAIINPLNKPLISGILEVSQGLNQLSIILQIKSILDDSKISLNTFFKARVLQALIAIIFLIIL